MEFKKILEERFCAIKNEKIALYVSAVDGTEIVEAFENFRVQGIMDAYPVVKEAYGKRLLSFEAAVAEGVENIIIVTRKGNYEVIRKRIAGFCRKNNIKLYALTGERLYVGMPYPERTVHPSFYTSKAELETKIDRNALVFFQMKDTLCTSIFWDKADADVILENKTAENKIEALKRSIVIRQDMLEAIQYAQKNGKEVILLNDTDYDAQILSHILCEMGMEGLKESVLDDRKEKAWLEHCKERAAGKNALFVGNPDLMQEFNCQVIPFDMFRVYSCKEMLSVSVYASMLDQETTPYDRVKIMQFATRLFNSPYKLTMSGGMGHVGEPSDIAYLFAAPYVIDFFRWFLKELCREKIDYVILSARDGYLLEKLYKDFLKYSEHTQYPEAVYVYTSRISSLLAGYESEADIQKAAEHPFLGGMEDMLLNRFEVPQEKIIPYDYDKKEDMGQYVLKHKDIILERSRKTRENYISYLNTINLTRHSRIAFFDLAASGSCQLFLEKLMQKKMCGLYFCRLETTDREKQSLDIKSCYCDDEMLIANMLFLETIFSSPEPNFRRIDDSGNPRFGRETRSGQQMVYCMELQKGIEDYCRQWFAVVGDDFLTMDKKMYNCYFLDFLYKDYTIIENDVFNYYVQEDEYNFSCSDLGNLYRY